MPFALKHKATSELFACSLVNIYDFRYYGVKAWEDEASAREQYASFLTEQGIDDIWNWELCELSEQQLKMSNVKLNNQASKRVLLTAEGRIDVR